MKLKIRPLIENDFLTKSLSFDLLHAFCGKYLALIISILLVGTVQTEMVAQKKCLSNSIRDRQNSENPDIQRRRTILQRQLQDYMHDNPNAREGAQVTIPVVFHIIHNGDAVGMNENLSDALLQAQLGQLNADYARMNADAANTPAAFQGVAANTMIQFCLATVDPMNNPTTGIVRTNINTLPGNVTENDCWTDTYIQANIIDPLRWNTANYFNIFTVVMIRGLDGNMNCIDEGTLGYAQFPGGPANEDVAVHLSSTIGSVAMPNPAGGPVAMGRTVTHEAGHWLMLEHIWFDNGCGTDDGVADTPPQDVSSTGCPTFPTTDACTAGGNGIMFMNYMDYSDDNCMNMFTQGQATRMMAAINASRPGLLNSQCGMNPGGTGYTCATAIEINAAGTYNAPGCDQGNGAIDGTHANWYKFTPPTTGMIRIYTCGMTNGGNTHFHVYDDGSVCPTTTNNVQYTEDRGCAAAPNDPTLGVDLGSIPVTAGVPILIEWDDLGGNTTAFTWAMEYMAVVTTCTDYAAADVPIAIPLSGTITSTISVPSGGTISDVNIKNLIGTHDYIGDLTFILMSPQGTLDTLIKEQCDNDDTGFNISLDDQSGNALSCPLSGGNTQMPRDPLSAFNGQNPLGNWVLTIIDAIGPDGGNLQSWTLEICTVGGVNCPPNLPVNGNPIASGTYQAGTQLTSSGSVGAGNNVIFRAGNNVELQPNFTVPQTSIFQVDIGGCP